MIGVHSGQSSEFFVFTNVAKQHSSFCLPRMQKGTQGQTGCTVENSRMLEVCGGKQLACLCFQQLCARVRLHRSDSSATGSM